MITVSLNGILTPRIVVMGKRTTSKSVTVLIMPAASRCSRSMMQVVCGVNASVQYKEIGLIVRLSAV